MAERRLRAGAAIGDITPSRALPNYNGALCRAGGEDHALRCQTVVFDDGDTAVAIVACDVTFIDRPLVLRIRDACQRHTGIPSQQVIVAATHTHAAPTTCPSFLSGALPDPLYLDELVDRVAAIVHAAMQARQTAAFAAGTTATPGVELNRRFVRPDGGISFLRWEDGCAVEGPVDPTMSWLALEADGGQPLAMLVSYPSHNNACGFGGGLYHPDFFGRAGDALRTLMPSLRATLFVPGAAGNIVFGDSTTKAALTGDEFARACGMQCAEKLAAAYRAAPRRKEGTLAFASRVLEVRDRAASESTFCHDGCRGTDEAALARARSRYDPEAAAVSARGATSCPVEIAALALGDAALVANPAELFVEFGLQIRRASPFHATLVSELTNGYCGYVPTEKAFDHGGYETHRTVYTSRLAKDAGRLIVEESLGLLQRLRGGP